MESGGSASRSAAERKRILELAAIVLTTLLLIGLSRLETRLFDLSETLAKNQDFFSTVIYFGLINFNVILILVLSFLLFRNVAKLVVERRRGVFGSNLRTKLVAALMFFALAPTVLLFYVSSRFIITSFDEWFSEKVRATMHQTREAGARVYKQDQRRLESLARIALQRIKTTLPDGGTPVDRRLVLPGGIEGFDQQYGIDNVKVYDRRGALLWASKDTGNEAAKRAAPEPTPPAQAPAPPPETPASETHAGDGTSTDTESAEEPPPPPVVIVPVPGADPFVVEALERFAREPGMYAISTVVGEDQQDVVKGVAPITDPSTHELLGLVMTETRFETQILKSIESIQQSFANLRPSAQLIRLSYLILLIVMTLLIGFSAVWLGFYVARAITGPIQSLAEGTREVALGNYSIQLTPRTDDETGQLVRSFNLMTKDLQRHRSQTEEARLALLMSNAELERRRKYMEVVLQNITAGVIAVGQDGLVSQVNSAAEKLLKLPEGVRLVGRPVVEALGPALWESFWKPLEERLTGSELFSAQVDVTVDGKGLTLLVDGSRLVGEDGEGLGAVLVFDDATEQLKVQRVAAWREVARRIAHEIKNPVTPIKLSAQRLLRRFHAKFDGDDREVFESCLETIVNQVDSLRDLVNEFSKFSRLPAVDPKIADLNAVIEDVATFYRNSYPNVTFDTKGLGLVPKFALDKEQMNRVFVNLVANAVEALTPDGGPGRIEFRTEVLQSLETVRIEIADNGCGIPSHLRERVLEPYYSTKSSGTGLGLAIVNQIITDHGGYLRIAANEPRGTKIVIELPRTRA